MSFNGKNYEQTNRFIGYGGSAQKFDLFNMLINVIDAKEFTATALFKWYFKKLILEAWQETSFSFNGKMYKQIYRFLGWATKTFIFSD